jgi:hypothetical protein
MSSARRIAGRLAFFVALAPAAASAERSLTDYRYFRALSIDLNGRIPTRDEVAAFEQDAFDVDGFIDKHLTGPSYAERVRRIYMDAMRLQIGRSFQFVQSSTTLRRQSIVTDSGQTVYVYFRQGQRRLRDETDGEFCLTQEETGLQFPRNTAPTGTPIPVSQAVLDANTVVVKPWWLYRDYQSPTPIDLYTVAWQMKSPNFVPVAGLLTEPDATPTTEIRICKEEAQTAAMGTVYKTDRKAPAAGVAPPFGRLSQLPTDSGFARAHGGEMVACNSSTAIMSSTDCGCGVGLERCMPGGSTGFDPPAFTIPRSHPIGVDLPTEVGDEAQSSWARLWWGEEAQHYIDTLLVEDRDFREILTGKSTVINGPLAQFYRAIAPSTCCGNGYDFGYFQPEALFDPGKVPADLAVHDTAKWVKVEDRGTHASGLLTMPVFLTKFGSRRGRAHVLYSTFLCREFVAGDIKLEPSTEPNLMKRSGCNTCHVALEPLAAYFTRVQESDWTYLPEASFPTKMTTKCISADPTKMSSSCKSFYDPAFTDKAQSLLRGAYPSDENANAGPAGIAQNLVTSKDFPTCIAQKLTESFLGRPVSTDDAALEQQLVDVLNQNGYKMTALVRTLVKADAYKSANNLTSSAWRKAPTP